MVLGKQLELFEPLAAALALRDTPYNSTAHALAEIVDNSIDARARYIDVLIMNERERSASGQFLNVVRGLAVADSGHGMPPEILSQALVVGGRPAEGNGIHRRMGKYGVGLPTSSLSQCKRVDVWTWQSGLDSAWHCYLDVDEVRGGNVHIPVPSQEPPPDIWLRHSRCKISNSVSGTLVVWSQLDRVDWRTARTTMERVEEEVGRIYRDFIQSGEVSIAMQSFYTDGNTDPSRTVRPNDPLYLMANTVHRQWEDGHPMFNKWGNKRIPVFVEGAQFDVEVTYSRVKDEVLLGQGTTVAGSTQYGRSAARNVGISVVREGRELMTLPPLSNLGDPRHRWWGCEVRFNRACDDLFGVDHSKQLAARLQAVHRSVQRTDRDSNIDNEEEQARSEGDDNLIALYHILKTIDADTRAMFLEIRKLRSGPPTPGPDEPSPDFSKGAGEAATREIELAVQEGNTDPTDTEKERANLSLEEVEAGLEGDLTDDGLSPLDAKAVAKWAASHDVGFVINPGRVSGSALFDVRNDHGTIRIILNQEHHLYQLLRVLSDRDEIQADDIDHDGEATLALYLLLCAWARMVEQTSGTPQRQRLENIVVNWGSEAGLMLSTMSRRLLGDIE